jgi:hypothetical protein
MKRMSSKVPNEGTKEEREATEECKDERQSNEERKRIRKAH